MADFKGMFIELVGWIFVILASINASSKDGVAGLVRLGDWLKEKGYEMLGNWLTYIGNDFSTFFLIMLGFLLIMYRGVFLFKIIKKYLPVKV